MDTNKSNVFLKVMSIIMIIGGALGIIFGIIAIAGTGVLAALGAPTGLLVVASILAILGAIAELIAGVIGTKGCKDAAKAAKAFVWGIIVVALCVISNVLTLIGYPESFSVVSVITGLIVPVLFVVSAAQAKKA